MQSVSSECIDADVGQIAPASGEWAIVSLQDVAEVVIFDEEEPRVRRMPLAAPLARVRTIAETNPVFTPAIHLEHTTRGHGADEGKVVARRSVDIVHAVEAPADVGESEVSEQPL